MRHTDESEGLLRRVVEWANQQPDIIALIMTGSHARRDAMVDELSDYDLEIFTASPDRYTSSADWMAEIGKVWVPLPLTSSCGYPTRLVIYEGGEKVDFSILPVRALEDAVSAQKLSELYDRGYRVLVDKKGLAARLPTPSYAPPGGAQPTEAEFRAAIEEFWFEASHIPKYLQRGDLWVVKFRDWTMKELLLKMLEWHTVAMNEEHHDVGHIGTRMKDWVRPDVWERLHETFGRFDAADSWRALLATVSLFRDLARDTAEKLGYQYPQQVDDAISGYLREFEGKLR
jgi:aminoglycoside 6-adenylyltransferase